MFQLSITIALAPSIALAIYIYQKDRHDREPLLLLTKLFLGGALSVIPVYFIERFLSNFDIFSGVLSAFYTSFIIAGFTEEYFKRIVVVRLACNNKSYDEKLDGIVYSVFSSLGFASVENLMYIFFGNYHSIFTGITRGLFAVPAHMLFGITMGYYLSLSKFAVDENASRHFYLRSLLVPVVLHGMYDFILIYRAAYLMIVFLSFVFYLWRINLRRLNEYVLDSKVRNRF